MSERAPASAAPKPEGHKPARDPFGPPLEPSQRQGFFRRLTSRPWDEQRAFVARINWNLLDPGAEHLVMGWLADGLLASDPARRLYTLEVLNKLPHPRRAKHAARFGAMLPALEPDLATRLADAFGPVLGGQPKRSTGGPGRKAKPPTPVTAHQTAAPTPPTPNEIARGAPASANPPAKVPAHPLAPDVAREANETDLAKLKDFFGKFGGAR